MASWQETYEQLKKKKKQVDNAKSTSEINKINTAYSNNKGKVSLPTYTNNNQLPSLPSLPTLKTTVPMPTTKKKEEDKKWWQDIFDGGALSDGYDFGDVTKTILGTTADVGIGIVKGVSDIGLGGAKLIAGGTAQVADWVGQDEWADKVRNRIAGKDKETNERLKKYTPSGILETADKKLDSTSALGETGDEITQGVGYYAGMLSAQSVGVPWQVTAGVTSGGNELSNAYANGATDGEAWLSAGITAGVEIGTEYLTGGVKLPGTGKVADEAVGKVTEKISKKGLKYLLEAGYKIGGEGLEEVLAGFGSAIGQKLTYMDEKELKELYSSEDALKDFVIGMAVSGITNGATPSTYQNINAGRSLITERTPQEAQVIETETQKRIKAQEDKGITLTTKEKNQIEEQVTNEVLSTRNTETTQEDIVPTNNTIQNTQPVNTQETVQDIDSQIAILEEQLMATENEAEYEKLSTQIKELEQRADQLENGADQQEIAPVQTASVEQTQQPTTQEVETNLATDVESNTQKTPITESIDELKAQLENAKGFLEKGAINEKIRALENGYTSVEDYRVAEEKRKEELSKQRQLEKEQKQKEREIQIASQQEALEKDIQEATPLKRRQYEIVQEANPMLDDYHTGIRSPKDIKSFDETINDEDSFTWGDFSKEDAEKALKKGEVTVYSSYPIEQGVFVSTSKIQAQEYAGGDSSKVYSKVVPLNEVAWINGDEGQYAKVEETLQSSAETLQTAERTTPTQEELDNLEYTRKNKSGSEYASEYYALGNKYGTTNLYKALNNYKSTGKAIEEIAPIRQELAETTKELVKTIKDTTKEVTKLKKELNEVKESVSEIVEEGKALTEADLPYIEQLSKEAINQDVAPVRNNLTAEESQELDIYETLPFDLSHEEQARMRELQAEEQNTPEEDATTEAVDPFKDRDYENIRKVKAYQYEHPEVRPFFQAEAKVMLGDLNNSQKGERYVIGDISQTGNGDYQFSGQKRHTTEDIAYLLDSQYGYTYADIRKGLNAIIEDHGAENIAVAKRIEFALNDRLLYGYTDLYGEKMPPNQDYIDLLKANQWNDYFDSYENNDIAPYEATSEEVSNNNITQEYNKLYLEELNRLKKRQEEINVILKEGNKELLTDDFIEELAKQNVEAGIESGRLKLNKSLDIAPVKDDFDNGGPMLKVSPKVEGKTTSKNVDWEALEDTSKGEQQSLKVNKLGETLTPNKKDLDTLEDTSKGNQQQFNTETEQIEDSIEKKTKKQIKQELLRKTGILNESLDNANKLPKILMENTDPIRLQEMIFGRSLGNDINKMFFQKVKDNTSEKIRFQNKERADIKALGIKARSKESSAVQKYGEKQWTNEKTGEVLPYGDKELASEFPNIETQKKIKRASAIIRQKYDSYLDQTNKVLTELGYDAIPKRKDYMRHFQELNDIFSRVGIPYNYNEMTANDLPTDINGLTADFSPSKNFFASTLQRKGTKTTYDAITGIDGYLEGVGNLIYHTEDIQRLRAYEQYIRDTYGENHGFDNLETLTDEEKATRIEKIQDNHLSNYASWLHEYTNTLAGKKALIDRSIEGLTGRRIYSFLNTTKTQVGRNMIGFNVSSAMTNVIAEVQALAKTNKLATVKGLGDTVKNIFVNDGFVEKNNFLTSRFGSDMLSKNLWQRAGDAGFIFMQGVDNFVSQLAVRSKYNELKAKGYTDQQAHIEAGKFASRVMGDRSQGATANIYNSQMLGLVTQFQLEVNNQLYSMFYDTYHESKEKAKGNAAKTAVGMTYTLGQLAVFTHLFGAGFEKMAGYNPTFDIIGILMKAFGLDDDEDSEDTVGDNLGQAFGQLVDALPYVNILTGGGRIPVSEAFTGFTDTFKAMTGGKDEYGQDVEWSDAWKSIKESSAYFLLPTGYSQIKKTTKGLGMYDEDLPIAGSYTDSGNLRFTAKEDTWSKVQAGIFGQWANEEAQEYVDSDFKVINKDNVDEMIDLGMVSSEYRKYRTGLSKQKSVEDKIEYINDLDVTDEQKSIMANNVLKRDYDVDMGEYDDFNSYEEFDYSYKNPEKYEWFKENGISYEDYSYNDDSKRIYNYAYKNPDVYKTGKAITGDFEGYMEYKDYIYDLKADKDSDGNSISGTRKTKVISYVNSLDLSIPQKAMLIRQEYSTFDDYNYDIVEYVDNLDIEYDDKVSILKSLDMEVSDDGTISW